VTVVGTLKDGDVNLSNLTVYTTASVTLAPNTLLLVFNANVRTSGSGGFDATVTLTTSGAQLRRVESFDCVTRSRLEAHVLQLGSDGLADTLTITCVSGVGQCHWSVIEVTGHDVARPVVQSTNGTGTAATTFSATFGTTPASPDSRVFAAHAGSVFQNSAPGSGMTELNEDNGNSPAQSFSSGWSATAFEPAPSFTVVSAADFGVVAVEIAAARPPMGLPTLPRGRRR
jgi:hypothetical protein